MKRQSEEKRKNKLQVGTIAIIAVFVVLYEILTDMFQILDARLFPGLTSIIPKFVDSLPKLLESTWSSMGLLAPAYVMALFLGIGMGILIGTNPKVNKNLQPIIFILNPLPPSILTPYLIALLPTFYHSSVAVIFIGCFWPILRGTIQGIVLIEQEYLDNGKVLELKGVKRLIYLILPAASPFILSGIGTAITFSFILLVVAEMFATTSGLGYFIQYFADFSDYAKVICGLIFLMLVILIINLLFEKLKKRILFWKINENQ